MSNDLLPTFEAIKSTIDSAKQQQQQQPLSAASKVHALERELEQLDQITASVDGVIGSIEATSANMDVILSTTDSTNKLLDLWIKILSQTSYTANLLGDKNWKGLSKNEEEYQAQLRRFDELSKRYTAEKQKREQEKEAIKQRQLAQEQRVQEREEALKRRVYGRGSRPTTSTQRTPAKGTSSTKGIRK